MSIVLKDGTVLPDLPAEFASKYPYQVVCIMNGEIVDAVNQPIMFASPKETVYVPPELATSAEYGIAFLALDSALGQSFAFVDGEWATDGEETDFGMVAENGSSVGVTSEVVWSNYDIYTATAFPDDLSPSTELYFPNSLSKPPFVLPDGTELPALPDGCFDGTPYGVVIGIDWMGNGELFYSLQVMSTPILALPAAMVPEDSGITPGEGVTHVIALPPCTSKVAGLEEGKWSDMEADDITEFTTSFGIGIVLWANHDLCEITELNEDMSYKVGSTVVRESDENYRVTGGYMTSIANEARRLGGKTGGMLPAVTEETLRGVTGGEPELQEKTVTPTSAVQVVVPDEGYDGLSKVTVEAVSGGGGSMFQTSASGRIPAYEKGTAESVLNADDISFATSAVG